MPEVPGAGRGTVPEVPGELPGAGRGTVPEVPGVEEPASPPLPPGGVGGIRTACT